MPTHPVALKEHILETLYSQKERARIFSRFLTDLWKRINELSAEQIAKLELQIGKERMSLLRQDKNPAEVAKREESLALLDSFAPEMKKEIFSEMSSDPRQQEFFKRKRTETKAFMDIVNKPQLGGQIVDIAGGAGDVGRALSVLTGKNALILDNNPHQVDYARELNRILGHHNVEARQFDVRKEEIPAGTWVAKHPCGDLADQIIKQWARSENSPELYLMTCCQGMARNFDNPYGFSREEWMALCKESDLTNNEDEEKRKRGQEAMEKLDKARVEYLKQLGFDANLKVVPGTIKGNVIIAKKKSV